MSAITISGFKVSQTEERYSGYTNRQGREVPAVVSRAIWLVPSGDHAPVEIQVRDAGMFSELAVEPFGASMAIEVEVRAFNRGGQAISQFSAVSWSSIDDQAA